MSKHYIEIAVINARLGRNAHAGRRPALKGRQRKMRVSRLGSDERTEIGVPVYIWHRANCRQHAVTFGYDRVDHSAPTLKRTRQGHGDCFAVRG